MKQVITTEKIPIKLWLEKMESGALEQAKNLANLSFAFKHIAIMPDSHQGYGMPIGGVLATKSVVIPNAVGVDIGCGMCAVQTGLIEIVPSILKQIIGEIRKIIPVGMRHHKNPERDSHMPAVVKGDTAFSIVKSEYKSALHQVGTLGGGNHFIEIQKGSDGHVWIMIHSGSRNIGYKTARHYNLLAISLNKKWASSVPKSHDLAFLPFDSKAGRSYLGEMQYCVDFALANRKLMMSRIISVFGETFPNYDWDITGNMINIAHNYVAMECFWERCYVLVSHRNISW